MPSPRTKPSFTSLVAFGFVLLPFVYVLSYAPVVRAGQVTCGNCTAYRPVDWMIDNTLLRDPLMAWAQTCGVRPEFEFAEIRRYVRRALDS